MVVAIVSAALLQAAQAGSLPPPPVLSADQWRAAARQDVEAIHAALRDNAPFMVVDRDSAGMRRWLEAGRVEALHDLTKVKDGRGYLYVLDRYVGGFRDGHIRLGPVRNSANPLHPGWPGFAMTWEKGHYEVGWVQPGMEADAPPIGAMLIECDGKPAEALARERLDRLFGNLDLEANRREFAFQLLRDYHFPIGTPAACSFRTSDGQKTWKLTWSTPADQVVETAFEQLAAPAAHFGVGRWGSNGWWIGAPTMTGEDDWRSLYAAVETNLAAIRSADVVVVDLRGNGGGDSGYGEWLASQLFGAEVVNAHAYAWGDLVFKAGPLSRLWAERAVSAAQGDPDRLADAKQLSAKLDAARLGDRVVIAGSSREYRGEPPLSPIKGRLVVLVDNACFSACLDTLDLFTRLPGVRLAGVETGADTIFMDGMRTALPSGRMELSFGIKAWVQRKRASNVPYEPDPALRYTGRLSDETGLKAWLARKLGVQGA